jgi:hypothetical protein
VQIHSANFTKKISADKKNPSGRNAGTDKKFREKKLFFYKIFQRIFALVDQFRGS